MRGRTWRKRKKAKKLKTSHQTHVEDDYISLLQWMGKYGFKNSLLKPVVFQKTGRGLMARKGVLPGTKIIQLPLKLLITTQTVLGSYLGQFIRSAVPHLTPVEALCLFLVCEKQQGRESFWYPYINVLPKEYTTAVYYTESELEELPSSCRDNAERQRSEVRTSYERVNALMVTITKSLPHLKDSLSYDRFRWAWCAVNTRSVYMLQPPCPYLTSDVDHYALAPFLDLLNHSAEAKVEAGFNHESQCYEIISQTPYNKYEEVFIHYGPHDNQKLLVEYGFVLPSNPHDVVRIQWDDVVTAIGNPECHIKNIHLKLALIVGHSLQKDLHVTCDGLSWYLNMVLNILTCDLTDKKALVNYINTGCDDSVTDVELKQCLVLHVLKNVLQGFPGFPSTIKEDQELLKRELTVCATMAVQLRLQMKVLLQSNIDRLHESAVT